MRPCRHFAYRTAAEGTVTPNRWAETRESEPSKGAPVQYQINTFLFIK